MHKLIEFICDEMDELERKASKDGKLSMAEVQYLDTLAHTKKNLLKAEEMSDGGYSGMMYPRYYGDMDGSSYADDRSYARGRGRNARRDSMGRYSRDDDFKGMLEDAMEEAPNDSIRQQLRSMLQMM